MMLSLMYDGAIVKDEKTKVGEVAKSANQTVVFVPKDIDEEELAGVSAMIGAIPKAGDDKPRTRKPAKKSKAKRTTKAKPRRAKK